MHRDHAAVRNKNARRVRGIASARGHAAFNRNVFPFDAANRSRRAGCLGLMARDRREGWEGWDQYAAFYDWENAQTLGRRDVAFWRRIALTTRVFTPAVWTVKGYENAWKQWQPPLKEAPV